MAPDWARHAILWHVYPLGALGAPIRDDSVAAGRTRRLADLTDWLDHLVGLGANGLLLGPVFASSTHGYDTVDHLHVDARLGDDSDLDALIAAAHAKGVRVVLDGVFNHVGAQHPLARQALAEGPDSPAAQYFRIDWDAPSGPRFADFEGHASLVALNHDSEAVVELVVRVMRHWLGRGVDGWRLDAAYAVPTSFWARVLPRVRDEFPDAWFVGEVIHGDYARIVAESGLDSVTEYELWKALWSAITDRNLFELDWALQRHNTFLDAFLPQTFAGNHDVTRIATRVGRDGAAVAASVLMMLGGIPSVYYGDEWGLTALKEDRLGGDDAVRPTLPAAPGEPFTGAAGPQHGDERFLRLHQDLIGIRRRHPWLVEARTERRKLTNERMTFDVVGRGDGERLGVTVDLHERPRVEIRRGDELLATSTA